MDQRVKVRIRNRKEMDMKQGSLEMKMGQGEIRIGVPVWGYTECNSIPDWGESEGLVSKRIVLSRYSN